MWTLEWRGRRHGEVYGIMWILELLSLLFLKVRFSPVNHGCFEEKILKMLKYNVVLLQLFFNLWFSIAGWVHFNTHIYNREIFF